MSLDANHRLIRCAACKMSFPRPAGAESATVCPHCGVTKNLGRLIIVDQADRSIPPPNVASPNVASANTAHTLDHQSLAREDQHLAPETAATSASGTSTDEGDFSLHPPIQRRVETSTGPANPRSQTQQASDEYSLGPTTEPPRSPYQSRDAFELAEPETGDRNDRASSRSDHSTGVFESYPNVRHYPTLEAMQRLYRIFGYASVAVVMPYLIARLGLILYRAEDTLISDLIEFSQWAVPTLFGTVATVGLMFAASEGTQLAIDLQDNTLRIANTIKRGRP